MTMPRDRRLVIGLLLNTLFDGYEEVIWRGAIRAAEEFDIDLLGFLGGALGEPAGRSSLFGLVQPGNVDGVVVISPAVGFLCGPAGVKDLIDRLIPVPVVSISERVPGVPSITVDNRMGMSRVVEHLATVHHRKRIAFVRGPASSSEAEVRYQAFRDGLARLGLPFDPALLVEGDHWPASGVRAVRTLLDERRMSPDALISSNDLMAIAAMEELRRRGLDVPADVAVAGFDDILDAVSTTPPLTTARQPLHEIAREAIRTVLAVIRGEPVNPDVELPVHLLVRQSCGCPGLGDGLLVQEVAAEGVASAETLAAGLEAKFPELGVRLGAPTWAAELAAALPEPIGNGGDGVFLAVLERLLSSGLESLPEPGPWFRVVHEVTIRARQGATPEHAHSLASLAESAQALVGAMATRAELARRMRTDVETRVLHRMIHPFPLPDDVFVQNLFGALDVLDVRSFFLSRYLGPEGREATLLVHHDLDGIAELDAPPAPFAAERLIPGCFTGRQRTAHVVLPIQSPNGPIAFALCRIGSMTPSGYEVLMHQISAMLSVNGLMSELQDHHRQLLDTARQAGMAEVAVGAMHNVGNLLNSVNVSADQIRAAAAAAVGSGLKRATALIVEHADDLPGYFALDPRAAVLPGYMGKAVEALWRELAQIQAESVNLQQKTGLIRESIRALQEHAHGAHSASEREELEFPALVQSALDIEQAHLVRWAVQVRQELGELPPLTTHRAKLLHVLVNLVKNAVEAMRNTPEGQRVLVLRGSRQDDGWIRLELTDSGEGIAPDDLARIFSYGFTTKHDGHGFGLFTCTRYAKQLGGSLSVASAGKGQGATFTLLLDPAGSVEDPTLWLPS
jgi:DNA-binding LacI/PurR family transcriptional regulator/signal transduction histidine kinase